MFYCFYGQTQTDYLFRFTRWYFRSLSDTHHEYLFPLRIAFLFVFVKRFS